MTPYMEEITASRHPGIREIAQWFAYGHLPDARPRRVSSEIADLAEWLIAELPDSPELTVGLRKLLEAKDCFVRAAIAADRVDEVKPEPGHPPASKANA